jgi:hypothetical protein
MCVGLQGGGIVYGGNKEGEWMVILCTSRPSVRGEPERATSRSAQVSPRTRLERKAACWGSGQCAGGADRTTHAHALEHRSGGDGRGWGGVDHE